MAKEEKEDGVISGKLCLKRRLAGAARPLDGRWIAARIGSPKVLFFLGGNVKESGRFA
jgi:hypothetical protein